MVGRHGKKACGGGCLLASVPPLTVTCPTDPTTVFLMAFPWISCWPGPALGRREISTLPPNLWKSWPEGMSSQSRYLVLCAQVSLCRVNPVYSSHSANLYSDWVWLVAGHHLTQPPFWPVHYVRVRQFVWRSMFPLLLAPRLSTSEWRCWQGVTILKPAAVSGSHRRYVRLCHSTQLWIICSTSGELNKVGGKFGWQDGLAGFEVSINC